MGLSNWQGSKVQKADIIIAKNYLNEDEIDTLNRLVVLFLESAELHAKNRQDLTAIFWRESVIKMLEFQDKVILQHKGSISAEAMKEKVKQLYSQFNQSRKTAEAKLADQQDVEELNQIASQLKKSK